MMRNKRHIWTEPEIRRLKESYTTVQPVAEIAAELGVSARCAYKKAQSLGLRKPDEVYAIGGRIGARHPEAIAHQFHTGSIPKNKGVPMSPERYAACAPTMFKKGNRPQTYLPIGSEVVVRDGYVKVKVAEPNVWMWKHRMVWEETNGPVPRGYNVQFKDGDKQNCALDNLYIISRAEQLKTQNSLLARYPKELIDVIRLKGAVKRQIKMHNRKKNDNRI